MACCAVNDVSTITSKNTVAHANENHYATSMKYGKLVEGETAKNAENQLQCNSGTIVKASTIVKQQETKVSSNRIT